ncbi:MAG: XdhC family protein [Pseudomonadota bacterium]
MKQSTLSKVLAARADQQALCLITREDSGAEDALLLAELNDVDDAISEAAKNALRLDQMQTLEQDGTRLFFTPFNPPVHVLIVGAVHIAQALLPLLSALSFSATVIDPRGAFARAERFANATVLIQWPDEALEDIDIGHRHAVVTLTHDPKLDDPGLHAALRSPAFYIGSLGSRRTHAQRVSRLKENGFTDADIARISAPVGLDIGGRSPAEIALSIAADIVQALRKPTP